MLQHLRSISSLLALLEAPPAAPRRPYTMRDYQYMQQHYRPRGLASCAAALGRTQGSLKSFLQDHRELLKRGRQ